MRRPGHEKTYPAMHATLIYLLLKYLHKLESLHSSEYAAAKYHHHGHGLDFETKNHSVWICGLCYIVWMKMANLLLKSCLKLLLFDVFIMFIIRLYAIIITWCLCFVYYTSVCYYYYSMSVFRLSYLCIRWKYNNQFFKASVRCFSRTHSENPFSIVLV